MKNLIEKIKKMLGMNKSSDSSKGFTLIELLIVIAIIGILAAGLLVALDPAEKIRQSQDTSAMQKITQTAARIDQWTLNTGQGGITGTIPSTQANAYTAVGSLTNGGGYTYTYRPDTANNVYVLDVTGLKSKKARAAAGETGTADVRFVFSSANGKSCYALSTATISNTYVCP